MKRHLVFVMLAGAAFSLAAAPSPEGEFDEAFRAGRPLAAERAFLKLEGERRELEPMRYFQAAEVSRQIGKDAERRTRLAHFIKVSKKWSDQVEQAAWELCERSDDVEAFVMIATKAAPTRALHKAALRLLDLCRKQKRAADFVKVAEATFGAFKEDEDRAPVYAYVTQMLNDRALTLSDDELRDFVKRNAPRDLALLDEVFAARTDVFTPIHRLRLMASTGRLLSANALSGCSNLGTNLQVRAEAAQIVTRFAPQVFDGRHGRHAFEFAHLRVELTDVLYSPEAKAEMSSALCSDIDRIAASDDRYEDGKMFVLMYRCAMKWTPEDILRMRDRYPQFIRPTDFPSTFKLEESCLKEKSMQPYLKLLPKCRDKDWVRYCMLPTLAKLGEKKEIQRCFVHELLFGGDPSGRALLQSLVDSGMTDKERADLLAVAYARSGAHDFWNWCLDDKWAKNHAVFKDPLCKAFYGKIRKDAKSNVRLVEIRREMRRIKRGAGNLVPPDTHKLFEEAAREYKGLWPQPGKWESRLFGDIIGKYVELCVYNPKSAAAAVRNMIDKIDFENEETKREPIWKRSVFVWNAAQDDIKAVIELARRAKDASIIAEFTLEKGTSELPLPIEAFAKIDPVLASDFIGRNWNITFTNQCRFTPELEASLLSALFKGVDCGKIKNRKAASTLFPVAKSVVEMKPELAAGFPLDKLANEVLDPKLDGGRPARAFLALCAAVGKVDAYLQRYVAALSRTDVQMRLPQMIALLEMPEVTTFGDAGKGVIDRFDGLFATQVMPALRSFPDKSAPQTWVCTDPTLADRVVAWSRSEARKDRPDTKALVDEFFREMARLKNAGAKGFTDGSGSDWTGRIAVPYFRRVLEQGLNTTNAVLLAQVANPLGKAMTRHSLGPDKVNELFARLQEEDMWEPLYLFASAIEGDQDKAVLAAAARYRAEASAHLPGVYPVTEKDPLFPLYVAADEYMRNNFERASELLTANLLAFERDAAKLPPPFVAWAVDQMRIMRGAKDAMLLRARALATKMLADESKLTHDVAAAMLLVRAESFRDQQNFEAAKLEYQTLRNNPDYAKTPAGRRAMFRAVDLMIESGNASAAEPTLEFWLSQPDPEVQAQAHYFLARIAFERKDYDECIKRLREVFAIDFTHTEARFLHGQWKLATNNEVDETEVLVGSVTDRTFVRPGQQLSITVQDRNLSVAGGGSTIPVEVRAVPGGDFEIIQLTPSSRDPGPFKGSIDVRLAASAVSNLVLEVTGADTVSYAIAPSFLAARGLPAAEAKLLSVVDDGRLAIGAGSAKMDTEESAAQVEALVDAGVASDEARMPSPLRPGNPLHIAVSDKDRSTGAADGSVFVEVNTTSGDRLANVELKEVRPHSGVFRGLVPTALPPPRAFASDTATGFNAGDAISSTHPGTWRSLADEQPVKWFEVDTMGSHLFSNVVIRMTAPEEVTKVRLIGKLAKDTFHLGAFPAADAEQRIGLRRQYVERGGFRDEGAIRE
ncbi:MAG: hypothetical protein IJ829_00980, partial [Kiritimatiellae bacterium]|nr:hypothetical protein [Kiritimatiellia bacterium]